MKANELRIGNLVSRLDLGDHSLRVESVLELRKDKVLTTGPISVICLYSETKPIPLTEEWLLKFGFEFTKLYYIRYNDDLVIYFDGIEKFYFQRNSKTLTLKYVHQLQNLFFCLCGKELELSNQNVM